MKHEEFKAMKAAFHEAAASNYTGTPYQIARKLGAEGWTQIDELANEMAQWAISFVCAVNDQAKD